MNARVTGKYMGMAGFNKRESHAQVKAHAKRKLHANSTRNVRDASEMNDIVMYIDMCSHRVDWKIIKKNQLKLLYFLLQISQITCFIAAKKTQSTSQIIFASSRCNV